jgi:hypothetical protein
MRHYSWKTALCSRKCTDRFKAHGLLRCTSPEAAASIEGNAITSHGSRITRSRNMFLIVLREEHSSDGRGSALGRSACPGNWGAGPAEINASLKASHIKTFPGILPVVISLRMVSPSRFRAAGERVQTPADDQENRERRRGGAAQCGVFSLPSLHGRAA